jgi:signal transduction protein with GAF and PtsI domain
MRSGKPIEERLRAFTAEVASLLSGGVCSILLFDRDSEDFFMRTTTLRISPSPEIIHFSAAGTLEELALRERRVVSLSESERSAAGRLRGEMILYPLIHAEEPQGVMVVQSASPDGIDTARMQALTDAADILADSIGISLKEESAALRMTKIAAINEAGINIISTLDLQRLLKLVATSACLIMEAESCVIRLLDPRTGKYSIREFYGMKA